MTSHSQNDPDPSKRTGRVVRNIVRVNAISSEGGNKGVSDEDMEHLIEHDCPGPHCMECAVASMEAAVGDVHSILTDNSGHFGIEQSTVTAGSHLHFDRTDDPVGGRGDTVAGDVALSTVLDIVSAAIQRVEVLRGEPHNKYGLDCTEYRIAEMSLRTAQQALRERAVRRKEAGLLDKPDRPSAAEKNGRRTLLQNDAALAMCTVATDMGKTGYDRIGIANMENLPENLRTAKHLMGTRLFTVARSILATHLPIELVTDEMVDAAVADTDEDGSMFGYVTGAVTAAAVAGATPSSVDAVTEHLQRAVTDLLELAFTIQRLQISIDGASTAIKDLGPLDDCSEEDRLLARSTIIQAALASTAKQTLSATAIALMTCETAENPVEDEPVMTRTANGQVHPTIGQAIIEAIDLPNKELERVGKKILRTVRRAHADYAARKFSSNPDTEDRDQ